MFANFFLKMPARLKRLTLKNFKSFRAANIPFAPGYTAIMGPNGSGKSNIIDAIVFVLGEGRLKNIRASRLTDLVHHKARDGRAIVSMDIVDPEGKEYQITREIDRRGHSVYRVNGKRTTRSEVVSLLAPLGISANGYNIVLQGEIQRVVKMTPRERRAIIDEVAGIAEYEQRKEEAMKELESVEEKIKDAELILGERKAMLERLKKDRDAALRYTALRDELRRLRKAILLKRRDELVNSAERIRARLSEINSRLERIQAEISELEARKEGKERELEAVNSEIREIYSKIGAGFLESLREERTRKLAACESLKKELENIKKEIVDLTAKKEQLISEKEFLEQEYRSVLSRLKEKRSALQQIESRLQALEAKISEMESEKKEYEAQLLEVERLLDEKRKLFIKIKEEHSRLLGELNTKREMRKKQSALLDKIVKAKEELKKIEQEIKELEKAKQEVFDIERSLNRQYLSISEEIKQLREEIGSYKGAANALKSLGIDVEILNALKAAQDRGELFGIHDYVFRLVSYDKRYASAVEAAAGRRLFYIVVDTADAAAEAIKYLKRNNLGRATFLPMDRVHPHLTDVPRTPGVLGRALDFVKYDEKYARAMAYVFGDTLVVDSVDHAKELAGKYRAVTLDGDIVERSGIMSGGAKRSAVSILQIASVEAKRRELHEKESEAKAILARLQECRERIRSITSRLSELQARRQELLKFIESAPVLSDDEAEAIEKQLEELAKKMEELANEISNLEMKKAELRQLLKREGDGKTASLFDSISSIRQEKDLISREIHELELVAKEKEEKLKYVSEKIREIEARLDQLSVRRDEILFKLSEIRREIEEIEKKLLEAEKKSAEMQNRIKSLYERRDALERELKQILNEMGKLSSERDSFYKERLQLETKLESIRNNIAELDMELKEYDDVEPLHPLPENPEARVSEILDEMRALEPVNMRAVEEYEEMKQKIEEIEGRISKLREEKKAVLELMDEIERKKEKAFMDAFFAIRKRFKEVYKELENGRADLRLTDEENIFNSGLIIEAQPKGKSLKNIDAMSGGEKSMVAIAFILAIALYRPAAFYILDEPDQALDKHNAEKVGKYIRRLSRTTQFIVVSHRDALLKEADQIIGVYMKEDGSSAIEIKLLQK